MANFLILKPNLFKFQTHQYQNKTFLVPNFRIFILHQTFQLDKFNADFKCDNIIFKVQSRKSIFDLKLKSFLLHQILLLDKKI